MPVHRPAPSLVPVVPVVSEVAAESVVSAEPVAPTVAQEPIPGTDPVATAAPVSDDWHEILAALKLGGMARELGQHCELRSIETTRVVLCLSPMHRHLQMKPAQDKLQQSLSDYFGRPLQLTIELEETSGDTPAAAALFRRREKQDRAVAAVEQDEFVREVIDLFDATLIESSIKPV
jgi:DNA polymerase-3 subunit gamma/tau